MIWGVGRLLERRARLKNDQAKRQTLKNLSDADLADMGAKRFHANQLANN